MSRKKFLKIEKKVILHIFYHETSWATIHLDGLKEGRMLVVPRVLPKAAAQHSPCGNAFDL